MQMLRYMLYGDMIAQLVKEKELYHLQPPALRVQAQANILKQKQKQLFALHVAVPDRSLLHPIACPVKVVWPILSFIVVAAAILGL